MKKQIQAPGVKIEVDPLPSRPDGFSGGVGHFTMKAEMNQTQLKANDPLTLKVTISGTGNLKLIKQPTVKFPKDFDTYDPKTTDKTRLTTQGIDGSIIYEYLAVPRHQGQFDIPPVEFIYYDTQQKRYVTLTSEAFHLDVAKGEGGDSHVVDYTEQEDIQLLANDIRHIHLKPQPSNIKSQTLFASTTYWVTLAVMFIGFISLIVIFRKRAIENADLVKARGKRANKVATKRLKKAASLMKENKPSEFYDEALRALWGYVGDKLNIPVEQLSRDNINDRLTERGIDAATIAPFLEAIDECEFERYAPGDPKGNMNKVYEQAMKGITSLNEKL